MKLTIILFILIYGLSVFLLFKCKHRRHSLGFLYLFWLHAFVGIGYVYMAFFESFQLGELYLTFRLGPSSDTAFLYVLFISISLLLINLIWITFGKGARDLTVIRYRFLGPESLVIVPLFLLIYIVGVQFRTLGVGLEKNYVLPFRLNGVIEAITLFWIPFYLAMLLQGSRGFILGTGLLLLYGIFNLVSFGSKYAALYPIFVFVSVHFVTSMSPLRKLSRLFMIVLIVLVTYTFLNPWYFRYILREGLQVSFADAIAQSFQQATQEPVDLLISLRNIGHRVTGFEAMEWAIRLTDMNPYPQRRAIKYLNDFFNSGETSLAPGHFGYFMIATGNHLYGLLLGIAILVFYLLVFMYFDRAYRRSGDLRQLIIGVVLLLNIFPFLIDGLYEHESPYLHLAFNLGTVYLWLFKTRKPVIGPGVQNIKVGLIQKPVKIARSEREL